MPTDAFKAAPLVCGEPEDSRAVFRTSGTTMGAARRGTHYFPDLALYDASLSTGFAAHLLPDGVRPLVLSLVTRAPDSSLAHMVAEVIRRFGAPGSGSFLTAEGGIEIDGLRAAVETAVAQETPVCVIGTSFALVHWLDVLADAGKQLPLPAGSRVMDTGGFKGRSREVTRGELFRGIRERLGVAPEWCVNEYGMTEMSSQFYDGTAGSADPDPDARFHRGPPWVRTVAADPETLAPLLQGEVGVLRHYDLANLHSVLAIQTADMGVTSAAGFRLLGRATGAEARGCSIAAEEVIAALGSTGRA